MVTDTGSDYEHVEEHDWMVSLTDPPARAGEVLAHGAALAVRGHDLLTVGHGFTLHVIAHGDAGVTDAHAARLWFPDVVVLVDFSLHGAAVFWRLNWTQTHVERLKSRTTKGLDLHIDLTFTCCGSVAGSRRRGQTHGAALAVRGHRFLAGPEVLAHHVLAHGVPHVAHADPTRLRVPHVVVVVDFSIFCAGVCRKQKINQ